MTPILSARGIKKRFSRPHEIEILKGIDLDIAAGDSIAIMGRSGEGKSTLLQILGTLDKATSGELQILDSTPRCIQTTSATATLGLSFSPFTC